MADNGNILLVTAGVRSRCLLHSAPVSLEGTASPFEALKRLADHPYATVLVDAETPELPELLAAIRRLRPEARLFAVCTPRGEYELRRSTGRDALLLEDYFIIPPTAAEWRRIAGHPPPATPATPGAPGAAAALAARGEGRYEPVRPAVAALDGRQIMKLVEAATDVGRLSACVAALAAEVTGRKVAWRHGAQGQPPGVQQLLRLDTEPPMTLWADEPLDAGGEGSRWISALRMQLPTLLDNVRRIASLRTLAITDDLTGAYNRRYFLHHADRMLAECRQRRRRATLLLYDIDDFKLYNDTYGHAAGDEILRETAGLMKKITRRHDTVARVGGDEFAVLFCELEPARQPGSQPIQTPYDLADRFRQAVNSHVFPSLGDSSRGRLTISGGLANFPWDGSTVIELLAKADEALMAAKQAGKNTISLVGDHEG